MNRFIKTIWFLLALIITSEGVYAQQVESVALKLVVGETDTTPTAGLVITPQRGWRIYAPAPQGEKDHTFIPELDWTGSENLQEATPVWPLPEKLIDEGDVSYVYTTNTLVPIHLTPKDSQQPIHLKLHIKLLSCSLLCVPVEQHLELNLVPGGKENIEVEKALQQIEQTYEGTSLFMILLIALLGGFILNFMPCVLPVLSIKLMHFSGHRKEVTTSNFLMTALGILASFLLLALGAIGLKASGELVGWGMHFQNPYFLTFLFLVIIVFAANMLGLFEFKLAGKIADKAAHTGEKTKLRDFFSGVFATLLATPCSAPFVGTSLSFALARNYSDILAVFMALGIGFASPYFVGMLIPSHRLPLPKPGKWMVWLQRVLGLGLVATAVWLGYVLLAHFSLFVLGLILAGAALILGQLWVQHRVTWLTVVLTLGIAGAVPLLRQEESEFTKLSQISKVGPCMSLWCEFDQKAIPSLVTQGHTVILDVTADWCVTCAVNKKLVFESPRITQVLTAPNVIAMRADWTKQSPEITQFLQKYGRFGIPFNIVFGPGAPEGIPLPEILTVDRVLKALDEAGGE